MNISDSSLIISYGDTILRQSDINILQSTQWLNDQIIGFYFEYCQLDKFAGTGQCFVGPEVTQCLKLMQFEELSIVLDPLDLPSQKAVYFSLNNNQDPASAGGSHWSLLIFSSRSQCFYHLDSSSGMNTSEARSLSDKLGKYMGASRTMVQVPVAQQTNGYDCGLHCIANVARVATHLQSSDCQDLAIDKVSSLSQPLSTTARDDILKLVFNIKSSIT